MDAKQFLKEKGISNNDFMDSGVADLIETLLTEYHTLQLQQTGVIKSVCKHCKNQLCDSQTFNQQCFKCGKKLL